MYRRIGFGFFIIFITLCSCSGNYNIREINKYAPPLKINKMGIAWFSSSGGYNMNRNSQMEQWYAVQLRNKGYNVVANLAHFDYENWVYAYESHRFFKRTKKAIVEAASEKGFDYVLVGFERATRYQNNSEMYCITLRVYDTNDKHELVCDGKCEERPYRIISNSKTVRSAGGTTTTQTPIEYTETMLETREKVINYIISQF